MVFQFLHLLTDLFVPRRKTILILFQISVSILVLLLLLLFTSDKTVNKTNIWLLTCLFPLI